MTDNTKNDQLQPGDPETTGHTWDGIAEFNNPLPRWWLYTFYVTIAWGVLYSVLYPAWPGITGASAGFLGYSTRGEVVEDIERYTELNASLRTQITNTELTEITRDAMPELYSFAMNAGAATFSTWCSQCHGAGAAGVQAAGYPNLLDDDWLWGGTVEDIHHTIAHGIRNENDPDARYSQMTAFDEILTDEEVAQVVSYVIGLSDPEGDGSNVAGVEYDTTLAAAGEEVYLNNCAACHMDSGMGDPYLGAPNLTDAIWLYGGSPEAIEETVRYSRFGVMPSWSNRLSDAEIRATALYVHSLGGGE